MIASNFLTNNYQVTGHLLEALSNLKKPPYWDTTTGELAPPSAQAVTKLNEIATAKLAEIVRKSASGEKDWDGYSQPELIAARELLNRDTQKISR